MTRETTAGTALEARGVSKAYGTVRALHDVDLVVSRGTVHGLVGENGSGKSTLTKVIAGVVTPDAGEVIVEGHPMGAFGPRTSLHHGLRVIYQDLALFPNLSVAENLTFAGDAPARRVVKWRDARARATAALNELGVTLDPTARVGDLSAAERQLVAIARAVSSDGRTILMDEPTAALTQGEIDHLLGVIRSLSQRGLSFVFISHKLREVVSVADDVTVLRNGEVVASDAADAFDEERISVLMTGSTVREGRRGTTAPPADAEPVLATRGLTLPGVFEDVDLALHPGRIVGLAGVVGSGRTEIGLAISGLVAHTRGEVRYRGRRVSSTRGLDDLQYVPEDRLREGLFLEWSVADNIAVKSLDEISGAAGFVDADRIAELAAEWRDQLTIKAPSLEAPAMTLSGGNQQRVLLARTLAPKPAIVVLNQPTVGVDVGSRAEIHDRIRAVADERTALLVISDEPSELLAVCDEILVVRHGRIAERTSAEGLVEGDLWKLIAQQESQS